MRNIFYFLFSLSLLASCKKSNNETPTSAGSDVTVYICGSSFDDNNSKMFATYWQDSVQHFLSEGLKYESANTEFYAGNQLYVAGQAELPYPTSALWMNGMPKNLNFSDSPSLGQVFGMYVSGNDIYLAGSGPDASGVYKDGYAHAKLWKNGLITSLGDDSDQSSFATAITVVGSDVYVAWNVTINGRRHARYSKNGITHILDTSFYTSSTSDMCSSGSDVYIAGKIYDSISSGYKGVYWKNGEMIKVDESSYISGIAVSGDDVYICGGLQGGSLGAYWINGRLNKIPGLSFIGDLHIAVWGTDVYVCGVQNFVTNYWKNGILQKLNHDSAYADYTASHILIVTK